MATTLAATQTDRADVLSGDDGAMQLGLARRRRRLLRSTIDRCASASSVEEALSLAAQAIAEHTPEVPFTMMYRVVAEDATAKLCGFTGISAEHPACAPCVSLRSGTATAWPLEQAMRSAAPVCVQGLEGRLSGWACRPSPQSARQAFIYRADVSGQPTALLIIGVSPSSPFDEEHGAFHEMLAAAVTGGVANACAAQERCARARDVAERDRTAALLRRSKQEVEDLARTLSHDVRAPIRHIDGFVQMLEELEGATLSPQGKQLLQRFRASADRLGVLIDDLVRLSLVGRGSAARICVDNEAMVRAIWAEFAGSVSATAVLEIKPLPLSNADPVLLRTLWQNLIGNALKFSASREPPRVSIDAWREGERTWYRIADNGVGFDDQYAYKLFNIFQRLHRADQFPGTGVGLAIARKIVELHGGLIRGRGTPDRGAVFEFAIDG